MESENTKENEVATTVTENAPDMNEFQQAQPTDVVEEIVEGVTNEVNEETTEITNEVNEETAEITNEVNEETAEITNEVNEETPEMTNEVNEETPEVTDGVNEVETNVKNDVNEETTESPENAINETVSEAAPEEKENTSNEEKTNDDDGVKEDTSEAAKNTNEEEDKELVQTQGSTHSIHETETTNTNPPEESTTNENEVGTGTTEVQENGDDNKGTEENKESLIEEVTVAPPINNVDNNFSEMHTDMAEPVPTTEESPITEITNDPKEQNTATEAYEQRVNNISNEYYSSFKNKQSITKPVGVENYKFSSEPKAIQAPSQRRKYRDPYELEKMISIQKNEFNQEKQRIACNIMYDPRVVRGNTYAAKNLPLHSEPDPLERHKQEEMKRRAKARKRAAEKRRIKTPEPVEGRRHVEVQTDLYLEELYDKVPEAIAATQTDLFLDRAPSPLYIPQKSGIDAATQIYDGELFDFNFEVEPILEVLVGKTLEQALIEVMEEEELEMLRKHQVEFEEKRNAELAEVQRLEDAERRRTEEKNRRIAEKLKLMEEKKEVAEKIAARSFTNAYLSNLIPSVFETLNDNGFFYDPRETEIENYFLPWLTHKSNNYVDKIRTSRLLLDHIILDSIRQLNSIGRPILRGLKERKIKKQKKYVSKEDWMDPEMIFKCVESKPSNY